MLDNTENSARRAFVKKSVMGTLAAGAAMPMLATLIQSFGNEAAAAPATGSPMAATEKQFRMGVIGPAELSLVASQIAVGKAMQANAKEFAGFELGEAKAVTSVLKDLGTPVPPMSAKAKATLAKIKAAAEGADFDKAYITAQLENHEFLRDLAMNYLNASKGKTTPAEMHGRHLATLSHAVFVEHVAITKRILSELR